MTNERAIEILNSLKDYYNDRNVDSYVGFDDEDNEALDMGTKALEQTRWIPVSERLPKDGQKVLVTTRSGNIIDVDTSIFYHASAFWKHYVTAWMPLPEPYKTECEEDVCKDCYYNDGEVHAECVICDRAESEDKE